MKKIIICLLAFVLLFTATGCGKSNGKKSSSKNIHKTEFVDMRYKEPKNYSKKEPMNMEGYKVLVYRFNEDENKTINLYYNTKRSQIDTEEKHEEVTINEIKWIKFHNTDFGVTYDTYEYVYNNAVYTIELNAVDKYQDEFDNFMKNISFE